MKCRNHPDRMATHTAQMPTGQRQPDGSYTDTVPFCAECAPRIQTLGWTIVSLDAPLVPTPVAAPPDMTAMMESLTGLMESAAMGVRAVLLPVFIATIRSVLERNETLVDQRDEALAHLSEAIADELLPTGSPDGPLGGLFGG